MMQQWNRSNPGIMELLTMLQLRHGNHLLKETDHPSEPQLTAGHDKAARHKDGPPTERQLAVFIASHYRALIADDASWNGIFTLSLIKGEDREFAEQCVAEHPAPTEEEIADADAALKPELAMFQTFASHQLRFMGLVQGIGTLVMFVCLPALIAAVLFRGGLVLLMAGVTFVRRDGKRASRLRVFWRALVAWSPLWLVLLGLILLIPIFPNGPPKELKDLPFWLLGGLYGGLYSGLAILSGALPKRGLPDRLAGTWPVPR